VLKFTEGQEVGVLGFRIYYGDGSLASGETAEDWKAAASEDVQCVLIFYDRTYECHTGEQFETFNYVENFNQSDYYWHSPTKGFGHSPPDEIPIDATVKHGRWTENFLDFYNRSKQDRKWR